MGAPARWTVRADEGACVPDVLARLGDPRAAEEGRAQKNGRRAAPTDPVEPGDRIDVFAARVVATGLEEETTRILAQRGGLLVAWKPAAIPTTADRRGARSMIADLARILGEEPHPASRLDVGVSGAVLCALGSQASRHVARMKEAGEVRRVYVAIAGGSIMGSGAWDAPIGRSRGAGGRSVPTARGTQAEPARTRFTAIASAGPARAGGSPTTLLRLEPLTGRMHQIRVHAADAGAALLGDREHGGARTIVTASGEIVSIERIALHAAGVALLDEHGARFAARAPIPESLARIWKRLDGDEAAWEGLSLDAFDA